MLLDTIQLGEKADIVSFERMQTSVLIVDMSREFTQLTVRNITITTFDSAKLKEVILKKLKNELRTETDW